MVETIRLKDPAAFQAAMEKMPDLMALMTNMYRNMGMGMQWQAETTAYDAHEITRWKLVFDTKPPEGATPEQAAMFAQQQKMMKAMYGDAMTMDSSVMEKDFVVAAGKDSLETLKQILDGKQNKITDSESFKQVAGRAAASGDGFCAGSHHRPGGLGPVAGARRDADDGGRSLDDPRIQVPARPRRDRDLPQQPGRFHELRPARPRRRDQGRRGWNQVEPGCDECAAARSAATVTPAMGDRPGLSTYRRNYGDVFLNRPRTRRRPRPRTVAVIK